MGCKIHEVEWWRVHTLTFVFVQYAKLCHMSHAPLHPFTGGSSPVCRSRTLQLRTIKTYSQGLTSHRNEHKTHTCIYWCMDIFTNALYMRMHCSCYNKQSMQIYCFVSHKHIFSFTHLHNAVLCAVKQVYCFTAVVFAHYCHVSALIKFVSSKRCTESSVLVLSDDMNFDWMQVTSHAAHSAHNVIKTYECICEIVLSAQVKMWLF